MSKIVIPLYQIPLHRAVTAAAIGSLAGPVSPLFAQANEDAVNPEDEIVVIAEFPRGAVQTEIPPVLELDAGDIDSFGASSVQDLLEAISSQTRSSRGRGSGRPIVLINGQRTAGFREVRDLPPESIQNVQVFPEELAVQYGFRPDQRVINFILKENYIGFSLEAEYGAPERGGRTHQEYESNLTRIGKKSRLNLNVEYENNGAITEAERDIVQDAAGAAADLGRFRTLAPEEETLEFNATYSRTFDDGTALSINGAYDFENLQGLQGLPSASLVIPASSPFAVSPTDETVERFFPELGALRRNVETHAAQAGFALNGTASGWRWSLTGEYAYARENTATDQPGDAATLQAGINAGTIDPFADNIGILLGPGRTDRARATSRTIDTLATVSGTLIDMPAGPVTTTFRAGYDRNSLRSRDTVNGIVTRNRLARDIVSTGINLDIPLADENVDIAGAIGKLSINGNLGFSELSDFGGLFEFGFGLNWEPLDGLVLSATAIAEDAAPSIGQLGNPLILTPNVTIFDFTNGETVLADVVSGGNFTLPAEKRRDIKLAINYQPEWLDNLRLLLEYNRNRSSDVASSFPLLTPEIEAAFPERVTRDPSGRLIALDRRPVSYSDVRSENVRYGLSYSKRIGARRGGPPRGPRSGARSGRPAGPPPSAQSGPPPENGARADGPRRQNAGSGTRGGRGGNRRSGGRWRVALYHTINLEDRILIRPGVQELDLLDGSATGSDGGTPRHRIELSGGWFYKGIGFRLRGEHLSSTRVNGGLTGSDLRFSDLTTLNFRMFVNLDDRGKLTENVKFLQNSRIALRIDNLFDDIQTVRDSSSVVPLRYQPGFIDPVGRYFEISFRKRF